MLRLRIMMVLLGGLSSMAAAAESAFVIDKLLVGVHRDSDLNSAIIKVLPTGTQLQVLERKDQIAKVTDADGITGWVDAAYLMADPPAAKLLVDARQERQMLVERIKQLEAKNTVGAPEEQVAVGKVDLLTNENTELKSQVSSLKLKGSSLEDQLKARATTLAPDGSVGGELRKANAELSAVLQEVQQRNAELAAQVVSDTALGQLGGALRLSSPWGLAGCGLLIVLSFGAGLYCMDYLNRRRHGGFRI
ncbi:MAG: TIGR04211 family SH3 domain-containing protein [Gammaproteobacteria bacterium]|nr:TIGR04211 family SH3 domain-containing protein [Gammaproteobacteria bacterium]